MLWDVNFDVGAAKTENENKSVNIYNNNNNNNNNNNDGGGGGDEELGMFDANLEDDVDGDGDEDEIQKEITRCVACNHFSRKTLVAKESFTAS